MIPDVEDVSEGRLVVGCSSRPVSLVVVVLIVCSGFYLPVVIAVVASHPINVLALRRGIQCGVLCIPCKRGDDVVASG